MAGGPFLHATSDEVSPALTMARQLNQAFIELADKVSLSVVVISVAQKPDREFNMEDHPFFEMLPEEFKERLKRQHEERWKREENTPPSQREPIFNGQGSGVVIREEGYIMTNRHVVEDAEKIKVRFRDGSEFDAEIRGVDPQSDIAVIKIDPKGRKLAVARLGDSSKVRVGQFAIAIGAPFELDYSVTFGHVSAKGRQSIVPDPAMDQDFIQTDANINPGNSGGPLVNIEGEVIGINTLIRGLRTGIGFAVPVNLAREVSDQLISQGRFVRAWLGIGIGTLKDEPDYRNLVNGITDGVVVKGIMPEGPASKSDLKTSDIITAVEDKPVATVQQLRNEIRSKPIGKPVTLDVHRRGKDIKVRVVPEEWPEEAPVAAVQPESGGDDAAEVFGLTVRAINPELAKQYESGKTKGVIVTKVETDSAAAQKGIRVGDVITEVNRKPVTTLKQFREALKSADLKQGVLFDFQSRGASKFEVLKEKEP
jgi:serine protease Do